MKATGIVRKIDSLGRIVIPKEIRRVNNWEEGTPLEIYVEGENVMFKEYQRCCTFCGSSETLTNYKGKEVCNNCINELA